MEVLSGSRDLMPLPEKDEIRGCTLIGSRREKFLAGKIAVA